MNTKIILVTVVAFIVGAGGGYLVAADKSTQNTHMMPNGSSMHGQMNDMMAGLNGKIGDDFDRAFIAEMILHHEGAVEMAEAALTNAKHDEIKQMANAIISAQTVEIQQMKEWQKSWYGQQ